MYNCIHSNIHIVSNNFYKSSNLSFTIIHNASSYHRLTNIVFSIFIQYCYLLYLNGTDGHVVMGQNCLNSFSAKDRHPCCQSICFYAVTGVNTIVALENSSWDRPSYRTATMKKQDSISLKQQNSLVCGYKSHLITHAFSSIYLDSYKGQKLSLYKYLISLN